MLFFLEGFVHWVLFQCLPQHWSYNYNYAMWKIKQAQIFWHYPEPSSEIFNSLSSLNCTAKWTLYADGSCIGKLCKRRGLTAKHYTNQLACVFQGSVHFNSQNLTSVQQILSVSNEFLISGEIQPLAFMSTSAFS